MTETLTFFYNDHLGSHIAMTDEDGLISSDAHRIEYSIWGESETPSESGLPSYTGKQQDASGLYYFNARYYDPVSMRFLQEDPAKQGESWYVYCGNDPVNRIDPDGMEWDWYNPHSNDYNPNDWMDTSDDTPYWYNNNNNDQTNFSDFGQFNTGLLDLSGMPPIIPEIEPMTFDHSLTDGDFGYDAFQISMEINQRQEYGFFTGDIAFAWWMTGMVEMALDTAVIAYAGYMAYQQIHAFMYNVQISQIMNRPPATVTQPKFMEGSTAWYRPPFVSPHNHGLTRVMTSKGEAHYLFDPGFTNAAELRMREQAMLKLEQKMLNAMTMKEFNKAYEQYQIVRTYYDQLLQRLNRFYR